MISHGTTEIKQMQNIGVIIAYNPSSDSGLAGCWAISCWSRFGNIILKYKVGKAAPRSSINITWTERDVDIEKAKMDEREVYILFDSFLYSGA